MAPRAVSAVAAPVVGQLVAELTLWRQIVQVLPLPPVSVERVGDHVVLSMFESNRDRRAAVFYLLMDLADIIAGRRWGGVAPGCKACGASAFGYPHGQFLCSSLRGLSMELGKDPGFRLPAIKVNP
jgi:hypothetical protein